MAKQQQQKTETVTQQAQQVAAAVPAKLPEPGSIEFLNLSSEVRTQIVADQEHKGPRRFACAHRDCPPIQVSANSVEEAQARYQKLMGIRSTEHPFSVEPV